MYIYIHCAFHYFPSFINFFQTFFSCLGPWLMKISPHTETALLPVYNLMGCVWECEHGEGFLYFQKGLLLFHSCGFHSKIREFVSDQVSSLLTNYKRVQKINNSVFVFTTVRSVYSVGFSFCYFCLFVFSRVYIYCTDWLSQVLVLLSESTSCTATIACGISWLYSLNLLHGTHYPT